MDFFLPDTDKWPQSTKIHFGATPDHIPPDEHVRLEVPLSIKPSSQSYSIIVPISKVFEYKSVEKIHILVKSQAYSIQLISYINLDW